MQFVFSDAVRSHDRQRHVSTNLYRPQSEPFVQRTDRDFDRFDVSVQTDAQQGRVHVRNQVVQILVVRVRFDADARTRRAAVKAHVKPCGQAELPVGRPGTRSEQQCRAEQGKRAARIRQLAAEHFITVPLLGLID